MTLYDAFISYSHTKDKPIAAALQSAIQKLGKPWYHRGAGRATGYHYPAPSEYVEADPGAVKKA